MNNLHKGKTGYIKRKKRLQDPHFQTTVRSSTIRLWLSLHNKLLPSATSVLSQRTNPYLTTLWKFHACMKNNMCFYEKCSENKAKGGSTSNLPLRLRTQLNVAGDIFVTEQNLSCIQTTTMYKEWVEQIKLVQEVIHFVDRPNRMICLHLLRCKVYRPEKSYAQVRNFALGK